MEEELSKAFEMWFNLVDKGYNPMQSIELNIDKINFMLEYNPKDVSASDREKKYHQFWNKVIWWLEFLGSKLS